MVVKKKMRHVCVMAANDPHFRLRIPADLKEKIEQSARRGRRTLNAEIVARLEQSFLIHEEGADTNAAVLLEILKVVKSITGVKLDEKTNRIIEGGIEAAKAGAGKHRLNPTPKDD